MRKKILSLVTASLTAATMSAAPLTVCDFENYEIGAVVPIHFSYGSLSVATVEADPVNPNNKVLHVILKEWGAHPELTLPTELKGSALTDRYQRIRYRLYRSANDAAEWKQFAAFIGDQEVYRDEGYPSQGPQGVWQQREYVMKKVEDDNTAGVLRLGIHHDDSDYYIDDVQLVGEYDDFLSTEDGGLLDYCVSNTSSSYKNISDNIYIPNGQTINVRTSRYSEWTGKVTGAGTLNIYAGGERSYIGSASSKGATYPDWGGMTGEVHLFPYKGLVGNCGFYGLIMSSGTFRPDDVEASNYNSVFANKSLTLHTESTLCLESGTRGVRIGELNTEAGSTLAGYYKNSSANSYYVIGGKNTDGLLAGDIRCTTSGNKVGLIKEGTGTYTITGNDNDISGGIRLNEGTLMVDNDTEVAKAQKKNGATGSTGSITVFRGATIGGNGSIASQTDVYGTIAPGAQAGGTLTFMNTATPTADVKLTLHPEANIVCNITDSENYSTLDVRGSLCYSSKSQDFEELDKMPRLTIALAEGATLAINDEMMLLRTTTKVGNDWQFDYRYPKAYTWVVEQRQDADGAYSIVARVTSLDYSGQGDVADDNEVVGGATVYPDDDWTVDLTDDTPLATYAKQLGKHIGVAAASYRYDLSLNTGEAGIIGKEFTMLVGENEMKFDATEPAQNSFSYGGADAIMWLADRNNQVVRGHTLAWHSQVPSWVSQDGKKNNNNFTKQQLLSILKNHIFNVVGKYKGRITQWDVCNEVLDDDQSIVRTSPDAYKLRPSIWSTYIGEEFIDSAFVWAHRADPEAKLYINDYGVEFMGGTKTEAYHNLVKRLQKSNVPIDGVGLQCHLTTGELDTLKLEKNIHRYADLGLDCIITELDIALDNPYAADALERQAKEYGAITRVFLRNKNCSSMLIWGISDNHSWRHNQPLLFDAQLKAKPAYYNVHAQMRLAAEKAANAVRLNAADGKPKVVKRQTYNMAGQSTNARRGMVIEKHVYEDGSQKAQKRIGL